MVKKNLQQQAADYFNREINQIHLKVVTSFATFFLPLIPLLTKVITFEGNHHSIVRFQRIFSVFRRPISGL